VREKPVWDGERGKEREEKNLASDMV